MTALAKLSAAIGRGMVWIKATAQPHAYDPYEREPLYMAALMTRPPQHRPHTFRNEMRRPVVMTARNNVYYPLD